MGNPISFNGAAEKLNGEQLPSPMEGRWSGPTVREVAFRVAFSDRVACVGTDSGAFGEGPRSIRPISTDTLLQNSERH